MGPSPGFSDRYLVSRGVLLNVDKPLKRAALYNVFCSFVRKPHGTKLKSIGRVGEDGGWFQVTSEPDAVIVARRELAAGEFRRCPRC